MTTSAYCRGLDIPTVNLVINYDIPASKEDMIHQIGRAGRFGRAGMSITLVSTDEKKILKDIVKQTGLKLLPLPAMMPSLM